MDTERYVNETRSSRNNKRLKINSLRIEINEKSANLKKKVQRF